MDRYPAFPRSNMCFPNEMDLYRTTSPLTEGPFSMNANDIENGFFPNADNTDVNQATIVAENNVSPQFVQDMVAFWDSNANGILESSEKPLFTYNIKIFISKDASYLKQAFDKYSPDETDVCFFLEDNNTDIFSDRTAYVKIGTRFQSNLGDKKIISMIETQTDFFGRYQNYSSNGQTYTIDYTAPEITELIQTGQISNPKMSVLIGLYQLLNLQNIILAPAYSILYTGLNWITEKAREYVEFQDYHWDPQAAKSNGSENTAFNPILFSTFGNLSEMGAANAQAAIKAIKDGIDAKEKNLKANLSFLLNPKVSQYASPDTMTYFIEKCFENISTVKAYLYSGIDGIVDTFLFMGEKWLNAINAFYCGLWNGVVEIFLGIIDMIKYAFLLLSTVGDAMANAQTLVPQMLEAMDEFIQTIMQADIIGIIVSSLGKIAEKILSINLFSLTNSISVERVAYFIGNIGGFIIELALDAFYSGGTKAVVDLIEKFGTVGKSISAAFASSITKIVGASASFTVESMFKFFQFLIDLIKKGKDEVLKWIDEFFTLLEQAAKLSDEVIAKIKALFGFTSDQIEKLKAIGLHFVTYAEEGAKGECSLCRIIVK